MSFQMFPCPHCKAEFDSHRSLEHHIKAAHADTPDTGNKYRCVTCDEESMACMDWLHHVEGEHPDEPTA
jgi:hypothetical protein